jgi:hypothetical protein
MERSSNAWQFSRGFRALLFVLAAVLRLAWHLRILLFSFVLNDFP